MNKANLPGFPPPLSSAIPSNTIPSVAPLSAPIPLPRSPNAQGPVNFRSQATQAGQNMPSMIQMANNLLHTARDVAKSTMHGNHVMALQDVVDKRWQTCLNCEFFVKDSQRCTKCGCFMVAKTKLEAAKCPIGKW
jgi:hypothetical protein